MQILDSYEWKQFLPSAYFDGAYHVVHDHLPDRGMWAIIDPATRTMRFEVLGAPTWRGAIGTILPVGTGAIVGVGPRAAEGATVNSSAVLAHLENGAVVAEIEIDSADWAPAVGRLADGYQLAYLFDHAVVGERVGSDLVPVAGPVTLVERYDDSSCAAGRPQDAGMLAFVIVAVVRRRRRQTPRSWRREAGG